MAGKIEWIPVESIIKGRNCWRTIDDRKVEDWKGWRALMKKVRGDDQYEDVKASIMKNGFRKANTYELNEYNDKMYHLDGHHRLAAAIELGYKFVPYRRAYDTRRISKDSWCFRSEDEPRLRRAYSRILLHEANPRPLCLQS